MTKIETLKNSAKVLFDRFFISSVVKLDIRELFLAFGVFCHLTLYKVLTLLSFFQRVFTQNILH